MTDEEMAEELLYERKGNKCCQLSMSALGGMSFL